MSSQQPQATQLNLLLLDDEQDIISSLKRALRKDFNIIGFNDGESALSYLSENTIDIIISDMRMPIMNGADFFARARLLHPNAIRILLTGYSDMATTVQAINEGGIYTYISKPWDNQEVRLLLAKASEHYLLKKEARDLNTKLQLANEKLSDFNAVLEQKVNERTLALQSSKERLSTALNTQNILLHDVLDMMSRTIGYRTGFSADHSKRIALQCKAIARHLSLDDAQCRTIYLSALLHEIGTIGLSDEVLKGVDFGTGKTDEAFNNHPAIGAEIIGMVKRLDVLTDNIRHQNENVDGTGLPAHLTGDDIPIGARIIRVVKDFNALVTTDHSKKQMALNDAKAWITSRIDLWYDKLVVNALFSVLSQRQSFDEEMEYSVGIEGVKVGDILAEDLVLTNGNIMLTAGQEITKIMLEKLQVYEQNYNTKITLFIT